MKCLCLGVPPELPDSLRASSVFSEICSVSAPSEFTAINFKDWDVIIISDKLAVPSLFYEISHNTSHGVSVFFIITGPADSSFYRQIQMQCLACGISMLPSDLSAEQIAAHILKDVLPEVAKQSSNVIGFFGTQPGAGVTSVTLAIARRLARISKVKVGVLGFNVIDSGDSYIPKYEGFYLDEIKSYLSNTIFSEEQLYNNMHSCEGFKYLAGNRDIKKRLYYTTEEISFLIRLAKETFDIVLIDAGSQYDNALTVQSLISSDLRFLIATQSARGYSCWRFAYEQVIEPLNVASSNFLMICNRFKDTINLPKVKFLQEQYNISCLQTIPDLGDLGFAAEHGNSFLACFGVQPYDASIAKIVENICKIYGIKMISPETPGRQGIIHKLFSMF